MDAEAREERRRVKAERAQVKALRREWKEQQLRARLAAKKEHQPAPADTFEATVARLERFLATPGVGDVLKDVMKGTPNKMQGGEFQLKEMMKELDGHGVRRVEDVLNSKQAGDLVREDGTLVQYKAYSSLHNLKGAIVDQAEKDRTRYGAHQWRDRGDHDLNGKFEYRFDADQLIKSGETRERIEKVRAALEDRLNQNAFLMPDGKRAVYEVFAIYDDKKDE